MDTERFNNTIKEFDILNGQDPNKELLDGVETAKELLYSQRMTAMLARFEPDASETLKLAARCQHIQRWTISRDAYPMDRKGYLMWRTKLKKFHGELAGEIMQRNGYDPIEIQKVDDLLNKRRLKTDPEVQTLEDVVCLVFLQFYLDEFMAKHEEGKIIDILQKTWNKMSEKGHEAALKLPHSQKALDVIKKALKR